MQDNQIQESKSTTMRFEKELVDKINQLREGTERNFTQQVKFMLKKYIEIINEK